MALERKVQVSGQGQHIVTIPKALAQVIGLSKGSLLEFRLQPDQSFTLEPTSAQKAVTVRVQIRAGEQYVLTIPKAICELFGFAQGTGLTFSLDEEKHLVLRKSK